MRAPMADYRETPRCLRDQDYGCRATQQWLGNELPPRWQIALASAVAVAVAAVIGWGWGLS